MDFIQIVDCIFKNKNNYSKITDEDKINSFYIINKKFSIGKPEIANFFNNKHIDKASALDMWFLVFKNTNKIPNWYWIKKTDKNKQKIKDISNQDKEMIMKYYDLNENDFEFLYKHYKEDVDNKIKILKR